MLIPTSLSIEVDACRGTREGVPRLLDLLEERHNVYTLSAEVEDSAFAKDFRALLRAARERGIPVGPLGDRLPDDPRVLPEGSVVRGSLAGRQGWLGVQR
ncbi:hypothetical protein NS274_12610 [Pseudomonas oryzihabitans]|nr:hypothetical protein BJP27_03460 [Pseudomonas psychrotolerans]KTS77208.1 hypothetical protein NS274_12610 [Pseudomonas psychrotolerans]KTT41199.1 hypothetical protein SB5_03230 [Pseudomonas psychrotolerans]KTT46242.1 hypothetical protein RSA46_04015 [Pseudomonas psychrotolerans]KTT66528.1 hypothetical protein NS383_05580 [Pseudomonas psychrotolerans]